MRDFDFPGRSTVHACNGMAATSHPLATGVAVGILRRGGNALDAAIAASATLAIGAPQSTGIGGDCFALMCLERGDEVVGFNGSGRAPAAATLDRYLERGIKEIDPTSVHAVTMSGAIYSWTALHEAHGDYQPFRHTRLLTNMFDYGLNIQAAIDMPRVFAGETWLELEKSFPAETIQGLLTIGHDVRLAPEPLGGGQAILIDHSRGILSGGSESVDENSSLMLQDLGDCTDLQGSAIWPRQVCRPAGESKRGCREIARRLFNDGCWRRLHLGFPYGQIARGENTLEHVDPCPGEPPVAAVHDPAVRRGKAQGLAPPTVEIDLDKRSFHIVNMSQ